MNAAKTNATFSFEANAKVRPGISTRAQGARAKARALAVRGEEGGGSEIVQTVIVLGFAVGLGAALMLLQGNVQSAITTVGSNITDMFAKVTSGAAR
ncbi:MULTISPECIES: hypothetical protein [Gordonibacter]|uniref:Uncharacterized protein n=1 Tax=Gordonibacter faecis TaxID=3047475 RepID=A0ABT7DL67_9ACTN|nr:MULTISPECIES: hypothetical protein [unclassified Gordonibacter]MDJ1650277.1 hypothetical protein [Gordonibacter sp. KGMB12511]